ncbi:hypothetical protein SAMN02745226_02052, partial [Fervidobacterium gondwanense DSM 13020]
IPQIGRRNVRVWNKPGGHKRVSLRENGGEVVKKNNLRRNKAT